MKNLYAIKDQHGKTLCYQAEASAEEAVYTARHYYGHANARQATFVREA